MEEESQESIVKYEKVFHETVYEKIQIAHIFKENLHTLEKMKK